MALTQARTMPGVMELLPLEQIALQKMLDTIRGNFEVFGFLPVETPVMEFSDVLLTKQGGERRLALLRRHNARHRGVLGGNHEGNAQGQNGSGAQRSQNKTPSFCQQEEQVKPIFTRA